MTDTIRVPFTYYRLTIGSGQHNWDDFDPEQEKKYQEILSINEKQGFEKWATASYYPKSVKDAKIEESHKKYLQQCGEQGYIEIETEHLFSNQFNSGGHRCFFWEEYSYPNKDIKEGGYITMTLEFQSLSDNTYACGYCGKQTTNFGDGFCDKCFDSSYLEPKELYLTRLQAISDKRRRSELSEIESSWLVPRYEQARLDRLNNPDNSQSEINKVLQDYENTVKEATLKKDGYIALLTAGISLENVIYYSHENKWCFGWRNVLTKDEKTHLEKKLAQISFPFEYTIKAQ